MALYLRKKLDNKAEIAVWHVTESEEELLSLTSVPNDELEEISLFRSESQRRQKLAVRALINEVFEEKMYLNHHDNGQPYLENCATNISITHTENYVAIIIHDEEEVGIDVESLDRDFSVVEKKALSEDEIDDLEKDKRNEQIALTIYLLTQIGIGGEIAPLGQAVADVIVKGVDHKEYPFCSRSSNVTESSCPAKNLISAFSNKSSSQT